MIKTRKETNLKNFDSCLDFGGHYIVSQILISNRNTLCIKNSYKVFYTAMFSIYMPIFPLILVYMSVVKKSKLIYRKELCYN